MNAPSPAIWFSLPSPQGESDCACAADILHSQPPALGAESDCACAAEVTSVPSLAVYTDEYVLPPSLYRAPLSSGYEVVFNPDGAGTVAVLNETASRVLDTFHHPRPLLHPLAKQLAHLGLLSPYPPTPNPPPHAARFLTLWLHMTAQCNLACGYCFAPNRQENMSVEMGKTTVARAVESAQAHGFIGIKIKYAGGEPTLNFKTVQAIHNHARRLVEHHRLELREVLLTNGLLLTEDMLAWLRDEGIRVSISLDGVGDVQDTQRPRIGGGGTFKQVASRIDQALAVGLRPHISITVTRQNVDSLADVARFALERGLTFNLNFVRPLPAHLDLMPDPSALIEGVRAVLHVIEEHAPPFRVIDGLLDRIDFSYPHSHPCGALHSYLAVGPRGAVSGCHMLLDPGEGSSAKGSTIDLLDEVQVKTERVTNPAVEEKEQCRACTWRHVCSGGCPLLTLWTRGSECLPSPYCQVYQILLPELIRLEGRRILKQHGVLA